MPKSEAEQRDSLGISPEIGDVSSALIRAGRRPRAMLVLAHGAGADMDHATMRAIAQTLAVRGVTTFRFNFPFMEQRRPRTDSRDVAMLTIATAVERARSIAPDVPLFVGGHSFGGRMSAHAVADVPLEQVRGLVFCAFPLHPANKPSVARAEVLARVHVPMLFLSGTRDALATPALLERVVAGLGSRGTLVWLDTADHGYRVLKRQRKETASVFDEMGDAMSAWLDRVGASYPFSGRHAKGSDPFA